MLSIKKYTYTFLFSPMEGILTPFTKRLVNCCDTKPFLKWILIKPKEKQGREKNQTASKLEDSSLPKHFSISLMLAPEPQYGSGKTFQAPKTTWGLGLSPLISSLFPIQFHHFPESFLLNAGPFHSQPMICLILNRKETILLPQNICHHLPPFC